MENFDIKKYHADQKSIQARNLNGSLENLYATFFKVTKESNHGIFFAFCHLSFAKVSPKVLSDEVIDPEYLDAFELLEAFKRGHQNYLERLQEFFSSSSNRELITTFSTFYQGAMNKGKRSSLGAFYTPISYCTDALAQIKQKSRFQSIYDPFCGGGAWLCSFLLSRHPNLFEIDSIPVYGTDIDKNAILLARLNLALILPNAQSVFLALQHQIKTLNSLYPSQEEKKTLAAFTRKCHLVATNPPYGFAVDKENEFFETNLGKIPDKEVFYFAVERTRELLPRSTPALFLVPNTFLFNLGSKDFKQFLSQQFDVSVWDHSESDIFQTANVRTALLLLKESNSSKSCSIEYSHCFSKKLAKLRHSEFIEGKFGRREKQVLPSYFSNQLNDFFEVSQGLIPYDKYRGHTPEQISNRVYHATKKLGHDYKRELQGKDVSSFNVSWSGNSWIRYGEWLAAPRDKKFFTTPRVLVREITNSKTGQMNCAFTDDEFYNTPSIINVICRQKNEKSEKRLKTLAVLLSSSFYAKFHLENSPKAKKGLFPKILVNDVRNLPLPTDFEKLDFTAIYDRATQLAKVGCDPSEILALVDQCVGKIFSKSKVA